MHALTLNRKLRAALLVIGITALPAHAQHTMVLHGGTKNIAHLSGIEIHATLIHLSRQRQQFTLKAINRTKITLTNPLILDWRPMSLNAMNSLHMSIPGSCATNEMAISLGHGQYGNELLMYPGANGYAPLRSITWNPNASATCVLTITETIKGPMQLTIKYPIVTATCPSGPANQMVPCKFDNLNVGLTRTSTAKGINVTNPLEGH